MVLANLPAPSDPPEVTPQDSQIADALSAWLAAVGVTAPNQNFQDAANHCASLCKCLTLFAPHLLSERDYFTPTNVSDTNVSRQRRYNTRRLARSLATWFNLTPSSDTVKQNATSSVHLAPASRETISALSDAARAEDIESHAVALTLAEVILCAAVHSPKRETFIKAVLTLSSVQQDALAQSIRRTTVEEKQSSVLAPVTVNDENQNVVQPRAGNIKTHTPVEKLAEPSGIPLADYKALAAERDSLRRKLAASEFEKSKATEVADGLKVTLEEATDQIRELKASEERNQAELMARSAALQETKTSLRDAHVIAEEIDVLRAKAASAEQLEASLKRASKRLEEVAEMRKSTKDLEAQISAFRENEERMAKHAEYLESQLGNSNERAQQLAVLSDNLSAEVEKKEEHISKMKKETDELKNKLETTNQQLTSMLLQSANTATQSKATLSKSTESEHHSNLQTTEIEAKDGATGADGEPPITVGATGEAISMPLKPDTIKEMVSDTLYDEIGVRMQWADIVECVRGVMDALKEMDEMESGRNSSSIYDMNQQRDSQTSRSVTEIEEYVCSSSQSLRSEADSHNPDIGSDCESRMSLLPEFDELDSSMAAASGGKGDEFDYAANHVNVKEIPLDNSIGRRRSSQLASIPENREGFSATHSDEYDQETSYDSGYLSEGDAEPADETVNATIIDHRTQDANGMVESNNLERKSSASDSKDMSPTQPDSPFIATDLIRSESLAMESQVRSTPVRRCHSLTKDVRRSTSLTLSVRSGISRTPSNSETTRTLVRQARNELTALQRAVELMRTERHASTSIGALIHQLEAARCDLSMSQSKLRETETELVDTRRELNAIIKEMDSLTAQRKVEKDREAKLLGEKERLLDHFSDSLKQKESEVGSCKEDVQKHLGEIEQLRSSEKLLLEKLQAAGVIERANELEITRLTAKLEAHDVITNKLNAVVKRTDGLHNQISQQRESHLNDIAAAAKREKELAEEAREEARRVARNQASVLDDVRAVAAKTNSTDGEIRIHSRKSTRFSDFWRRLLHREKVQIDFTMPASTTSLPPASERTPRKKISIARSQ